MFNIDKHELFIRALLLDSIRVECFVSRDVIQQLTTQQRTIHTWIIQLCSHYAEKISHSENYVSRNKWHSSCEYKFFGYVTWNLEDVFLGWLTFIYTYWITVSDCSETLRLKVRIIVKETWERSRTEVPCKRCCLHKLSPPTSKMVVSPKRNEHWFTELNLPLSDFFFKGKESHQIRFIVTSHYCYSL